MDVQFSKTTFDGWPEVKQAKVLREDLEEQERVRVLLKEALADGSLPALAAALAAAEALRRRDTAEDIDSWADLQQAQLLQRRLLQGSVKTTVANILQRIEVQSCLVSCFASRLPVDVLWNAHPAGRDFDCEGEGHVDRPNDAGGGLAAFRSRT